MSKKINRRNFIKASAVASAAAIISPDTLLSNKSNKKIKLGFIGTGEITKAVVLGILNSKIKFKKIYISKRNKKNSNFLKNKIMLKQNC